MDQLISLWQALDLRRRVLIVAATGAMFLAVLALSRMATTPNMALLYAGLDNTAAGDVVAALEQRNIAYEVRGNAIYVPAPRRDELRMTLASEGLPATGIKGYELLDNLSGFGTTSQMFDAAYWRAKEGELARTILSSPQFRSARVMIGRDGSTGLKRGKTTTASVTVTAANGALTTEQAKALKYLVGSAVAGLLPENVSVIDGQTGQVFVGNPNEKGNSATDDRAATLKKNVERLLAARVGAGHAVVEVAVEAMNQTESITEKKIDPNTRVAISTETQETTANATEPTPGVTVASNLPTGNAQAGAAGRSQNSQTRARTNYEVSQTQRELVKAPGEIRRLTVAVLVDGVATTANGQTTMQPRSAQELADLQELVASAVGYDKARGDVITIRSMAFQPPPQTGTAAAPSFLDKLYIDVMMVIQLTILALVVLGLGIFVVRPILLGAAKAPRAPSLPGPDAPYLPVLTGEIDDGAGFADAGSLSLDGADEGSGFSDLASLTSAEDPVERLRKMIGDRQDETVDILRGWMEKGEEAA